MRATAAKVPLWKRLRAKRISADTLLHKLGIYAPPIDVEAVARALGVNVTYLPWAAYPGRLVVTDDAAEIEVSKFAQVPFRQRFTIGHELGHLMLHDVTEAYRPGGWHSDDPMEIEANRYAADLLMPLWMLDPVAMSYGADVPRLARMFQVSEAAMRVRLGNLAGLR